MQFSEDKPDYIIPASFYKGEMDTLRKHDYKAWYDKVAAHKARWEAKQKFKR